MKVELEGFMLAFVGLAATDRKRGLRGEGRVEVLGVELGFSGFGFQSFRGLGSLQGLIN